MMTPEEMYPIKGAHLDLDAGGMGLRFLIYETWERDDVPIEVMVFSFSEIDGSEPDPAKTVYDALLRSASRLIRVDLTGKDS